MLSGSELWLLRLMAERGAALLDTSTFMIVLEERGELEVAAAGGDQPAVRNLPLANSALGRLFARRESLALELPQREEALWLEELGLEAEAALVEPFSLEPHGAGLIIALRRQQGFGRHDRQALAAFARTLAARISQERLTTIERLRYGQLMREHERRRWARELHDETIQGLGALRMQLASAQETADATALREAVERVLGGLDREIKGIRHLITELRPAALDDLGLAEALGALARRVQDLYTLQVRTLIELTAPSGKPLRLSPELESTVYRIVQEALTNVARHARAREATVAVRVENDEVCVTIEDDGVGVPEQVIHRVEAASALQPTGEEPPLSGGGGLGGFGLPGMVERAELVGGNLRLGRRPGGGTGLRVVAPLVLRGDEDDDLSRTAIGG